MRKRSFFKHLGSNNKALIVVLILCSVVTFGQNHDKVHLIDLDSTWGKEVFPFPIRFAQNINYEGVEEARFPPEGWSDENHQNFWSYAFAWDINLNKKITEAELASDIEKYFDGLVGDEFIKGRETYKASAVFIEVEGDEMYSVFKGKIKTFDRFTTKELITLYVLVESHYCKKEGRSILLFRFSPKRFTHEVWKTLENVKLKEGVCDE
ncbi:hypothetical protein [uncultured Dokdonia sp.]|uniref:hypothetical protein n=1 Tax=uncultured Dokdonia sp. TaxID=575653 RepID=UPI0026144E35|nr:hypothetical protein [uncultured Dokdonia sp.]